MRGYPQYSFWISITLVKIYISCININQGKNTFELVGTVLNTVSRCVVSGCNNTKDKENEFLLGCQYGNPSQKLGDISSFFKFFSVSVKVLHVTPLLSGVFVELS